MKLIFNPPSQKAQGIAGLCWAILYFLTLISQTMIIDQASSFAGFWTFVSNMHYATMLVVGIILIQWSLEKIGFSLPQMHKLQALIIGILVLLGVFGKLSILQPYFWIILLVAGMQLAFLGLRSL